MEACFFREFNIYNLFKSFINTVLSFSLTRCEYYLWLDSKYTRRCDVLVQNKTIHSLNLFALDQHFFKNGKSEPLVKPSMWIRGRVVRIIVFIVSIWSDLLALLMIYVKY